MPSSPRSWRAAPPLAVAASGGGGPTPPAKPLANAIHDALAGAAPDGITADITFTNKLFPSGALTGAAGSALMSGATGRLWATNDGRGRLELQSSAGDVQIVWNADKVTAYDATSNTVYSFTLPKQASSANDSADAGTPPALSEITKLLSDLSEQATVSDAQPDNVGDQPAYTVTISPKHDGGCSAPRSSPSMRRAAFRCRSRSTRRGARRRRSRSRRHTSPTAPYRRRPSTSARRPTPRSSI